MSTAFDRCHRGTDVQVDLKSVTPGHRFGANRCQMGAGPPGQSVTQWHPNYIYILDSLRAAVISLAPPFHPHPSPSSPPGLWPFGGTIRHGDPPC